MSTLRTDRELTGPFWAAIDRRVLVRPVCDRCGHSFFTPQVACPRCQSTAWTYLESSGHGRVYSHTTIHRPPDPSFEPPYVIADVELEEGWRMLSWVVNCEPASVEIDMAVRVCFVEGPDGELLPAFEPEAAS
jgi:uncharacterized OB-fold protein